MAQTNDFQKILDLIPGPAFTVTDHCIRLCNGSALSCMIEPGTDISGAFPGGSDAYESLADGCLYTTIRLADTLWGATIVRMEGADMFRLDQNALTDELKAMALVNTELRCSIANLTMVNNLLYDQVESKDLAASASQELNKILRILNNISNAARYIEDTGFHQEERDVCSILEEFLNECAHLLAQAGITLDISVPQQEIFTMVDWQMLRQAVYNMLDNAAKFTEPGGRIHATLSRTGSMLRLSVSDHGPGIAEEVRGSLFSRYTRQPGLDSLRSGLGLGMLLVRTAATAHGGTVLVDSPEGFGTRVTFTMAIRHADRLTLRSRVRTVISSPDDGLVMLSNVLPKELYKPNGQ